MSELPVQKRKAILLVIALLSLALVLGWFKRVVGTSSDNMLNLDCQISQSLNSISNGEKKPSPISINIADVKALCLLSGIGEVKALRIIEYRQMHGKFNCLKELINVKGIGQKTFERIKNNISL